MVANFARVSLVAAMTVQAAANSFLRAQPKAQQHVAAELVEDVLLSELTQIGGRTTFLQEELRGMFAALPKNEFGRLDSPTVRYALHRFFVQERGWYVEGLHPDGGSFNTTSPTEIMKDRVPAYIQTIVEEQVRGRDGSAVRGLDLQSLAAFAASIEDLVHGEASQLLAQTFETLGLSTVEPLTEDEVDLSINAYLLSTVVGGQLANLTRSQVMKLQKKVHLAYPPWPDVTMWARDLRHSMAHTHQLPRSPFSDGLDFPQISKMLEEVGYQFGSFQNQECRVMKDRLVDKEVAGTGRVPLSRFYDSDGDDSWQFSESLEYLKAIGALDDSDSRHPSVVIPNYIQSHSNCLASSSFYSVCCLNECEGLMTQLERSVVAPEAAPEQLATLVAGLSSDTVDAPRNLSSTLTTRLQEIADLNEGRVPLHGRLFAQWMHHAFPRECPYPHVAGSTNPMTPDEWMAAGSAPTISQEEKEIYASGAAGGNSSTHGHPEATLPDLPWDLQEELVAAHEGSKEGSSWSKSPVVAFLRSIAQIAVVVASGVAMFSSATSARRSWLEGQDKLPKYMV